MFIALTEGISACEMLAEAIRQGPLAHELAFPYHPHVTVAHDLDDAALDLAFDKLADYRCAFDVTAFHLYVHGSDGVWRPEQNVLAGATGVSVRRTPSAGYEVAHGRRQAGRRRQGQGSLAAARRRSRLLDHTMNTLKHYGNVQGGVLAGAVTYFGFLSFFPILALAFA